MPDYGMMPRIKRVSLAPKVKRVKYWSGPALLEAAQMGKVIYEAGNFAGYQALMEAYNSGVRDREELNYIRNSAQDKARSDVLKLLDELMTGEKGLPEITVTGKFPSEED